MPWYVALPCGLVIYFMYLCSLLKGDKETLAHFGYWYQQNSLIVFNGLFAYILLFIFGCFVDLPLFGINGGLFTVPALMTISWGPSSAFNAWRRVTNNKH